MDYLMKGGRRLSSSELRKELTHLKQEPDESLEDFVKRTQCMVEGGYPDTPVIFQEIIAVNTFISGCIIGSKAKDVKNKDPNDLKEALKFMKEVSEEMSRLETEEEYGNINSTEEESTTSSTEEESNTSSTEEESNISNTKDKEVKEKSIDEENDIVVHVENNDDMEACSNKIKPHVGTSNQLAFITKQKLHSLVHDTVAENKARDNRKNKPALCDTQTIYMNNPDQQNIDSKTNRRHIHRNRYQDQEVKQLAKMVNELAPNFIYRHNRLSSNTLGRQQYRYWVKMEDYEASDEIQREPMMSSTTYQPELKDQGVQTLKHLESCKRNKTEEKGTQTECDIISTETTGKEKEEDVNREDKKHEVI